jgi:hypothetical protein
VKTGTIVALVVAGATAVAAIGLWRLPVDDAGNVASDLEAPVAPAPAPASAASSPSLTSGDNTPTAARASDPAWRTPSSPSPRYAEPEDIERQLAQFIAEQPGLQIVSLSSIDCSATACEIALTGAQVNPRYVGAYSELNHKLFAAPWKDFRILFGGISTREIAPGAREYVLGFEYHPLVDLSADPLIAARQYAACAAAWRRQTEIGPHPDDEARYYLEQAERYVALAASVLGEQEATRVAAETRGGPLIRDCNPG